MLIQRMAETQQGEAGIHTGPLGSDRVTCVLWEDEKKPAPRLHRRDKKTLIWSDSAGHEEGCWTHSQTVPTSDAEPHGFYPIWSLLSCTTEFQSDTNTNCSEIFFEYLMQ